MIDNERPWCWEVLRKMLPNNWWVENGIAFDCLVTTTWKKTQLEGLCVYVLHKQPPAPTSSTKNHQIASCKLPSSICKKENGIPFFMCEKRPWVFFQAIPLRRQFIATSYFRLRIYHKSIYSKLPRFLVKQVCISSPLRAYWWSALAKPMSPQSVRYAWPWITSRYHASPRSTSLRIVVLFFSPVGTEKWERRRGREGPKKCFFLRNLTSIMRI